MCEWEEICLGSEGQTEAGDWLRPALHWKANELRAADEGREAASGAPSQPRGLRLSKVTRREPGLEPDMKQTPARFAPVDDRGQSGWEVSCRTSGRQREGSASRSDAQTQKWETHDMSQALHFYHAMKCLRFILLQLIFSLCTINLSV